MRSFLLKIACLYIRNFVVRQMRDAEWTQSDSNPAHWISKPVEIDGSNHSSSVHEVTAATMLLTDMLNNLYRK
jgi:hypothetical protein